MSSTGTGLDALRYKAVGSLEPYLGYARPRRQQR